MKKNREMSFVCMVLVFLLMGLFSDSITVQAARDPYGMEFTSSPYPYTTQQLGSRCKIGDVCKISLWAYNDSDVPYTITMSSTREDVVQPVDNSFTVPADTRQYQNYTFTYKIVKEGIAAFTFTMGDKKLEHPIFVIYKEGTPIKKIEQTDYKTMKITWDNKEEFSGYYIMRAANRNAKFETIKTVEGGRNSSTTLTNKEWNKNYIYMVRGYMKYDSYSKIGSAGRMNGWVSFMMKKVGTSITGINKKGSSSVKIQWKKLSGDAKYQLYRSDAEHGTYQCIYTTKNAVSYTQKVSKGKTYYYKIKTIYPEMTSDFSEVVSKMLPKTASVVKKKIKFPKKFDIDSQYGYYWSSPDDAYYYTASGKFYVVVPGKNCFRIYTLNQKFKRVKTKKIKVKYEEFGGFFHGTDGNFYVAVGYKNAKESDTKTVIKVIQYNKNWKKGKTCEIKGNAANTFKGIYMPFEGGSCRMDMQGTMLYVHTSRKMYIHSDGLRHQSNISFEIDTRSMTGKATGDSYVSHSFNQYVRFDNGNLYLLDHGDAYPRSVVLRKIIDYNTESENHKGISLIKLLGETGDNQTECTVGGMEIAGNNVLVCGTSQPHHGTIKGVTGWSGQSSKYLKHNVYLSVTDTEMKETQIKWLTQYHPKTSKIQVGETRMVKLDDNRFAVMYNTTKKEGGKPTLHYVVCNGSGQTVYSKTYSNMTLRGGTQPILYRGRIVWVDDDYRTEKKMVYAIPALQK